MTMTEPVVASPVAAATSALAEEQWRVATLVSAVSTRSRWDATLGTDARWRLTRRGHFPRYADELDWTPREVVGHLRDSARVFTERLRRMTSENDPRLPDFVPADADRVAAYRATPAEVLADELRTAQARLLATIAGLGRDDLGRTGVHEVDGPVTVAELIAFLPAHQRDHAEQLAALLGR
jgi:DinB superfamily